MKIKLEMLLSDIENYTVGDWLGWTALVMFIGVLSFRILIWVGVLQ